MKEQRCRFDLDPEEHEHRYDDVRRAIEQCRSHAHSLLIAGELHELKFLSQWQQKVTERLRHVPNLTRL